MNFDVNKLEWTREPEKYFISEDKIEIITKPHTLEEVGQIFGVTRERIRQIENKAIRKLRHPSRAKKIKDFYC